MSGHSPPPPPQAARALVRQLFSLKARRPEVSATLLDEPGDAHAALELVNEGGDAIGLICRCETSRGLEDLDLGGLPPGGTVTVEIGAVHGEFRCVWSCRDARRRRYVWTYDGKRRRLHRGDRQDLDGLFAYAYSRRRSSS